MPLARVALALALVACGSRRGAEEPQEDTNNDPQVLAAKMRDALAEMVAAAEAHPEDCPAIAKALTAVFDDVRPLFDHVQTLAKDPDKARELTTAFKPHEQQADALATRLSNAINPCHGDPAFRDAIARMPTLP